MTPLLIALAAQAATPAPVPSPDEARYRACASQVRTAPERALETAGAWRIAGGGLPARMCLGMAYAALERWAPAATAFEQGALEAEGAHDARSADFWVQSGNAWLAGDDPAKARKAFDAALAGASLTAELRGEAHLDRARAAFAQNDLAAARADIDKGLELVPGDPFGWYLSASLARQERNLPRARTDIAKAVELAPDDADILLEAGNVAGLSGDAEAARGLFTRVARAAPETQAGRAAAAALAANITPVEPAQPAAPPQPR